MTQRSDEARLLHMRDSALWIGQWVKNRQREEFNSDRQFQSSVIRELQIIGEAAHKISRATREKYPDIEWEKVAAVRHVLVHDYMDTDIDVVWKIATFYAPQGMATSPRAGMRSFRECRVRLGSMAAPSSLTWSHGLRA